MPDGSAATGVSADPGRHRPAGGPPPPVRLALLVGALLAAFSAGVVLLPDAPTRAAAENTGTRDAPDSAVASSAAPGGGVPTHGGVPTQAGAPGPAGAPAATGVPPAGGIPTPAGVGVLRARETPRARPPGTAPAKRPPAANPAASDQRAGKPRPQEPATDTSTTAENEVTILVNEKRAAAGCQPVRTDERLRAAARAHSGDMARNDYFSHDGRNGSTPWARAKQAGYPRPIGENIAKGQPTPAEVMKAWMDSDGHRRNIVNCAAKETGVGLAYDGSTPVWTQMFGAG
ncbi:MAG TPA: CAP domain-containing protein [Catenuloplanes sp.]